MGGRRQEDDDDIALRVLGIDLDSVDMTRAKAFRKELEKQERETFRDVAAESDESSDDSESE